MARRHSVTMSYLDSAQIHRSLDDVVIVCQTKQLYCYWLQEWPCIHLCTQHKPTVKTHSQYHSFTLSSVQSTHFFQVPSPSYKFSTSPILCQWFPLPEGLGTPFQHINDPLGAPQYLVPAINPSRKDRDSLQQSTHYQWKPATIYFHLMPGFQLT